MEHPSPKRREILRRFAMEIKKVAEEPRDLYFTKLKDGTKAPFL